MIKKNSFVNFLEKVYLGKTIESLILEVEDKTLSCYLRKDSKLVGNVELKEFDCEDSILGIYNPDVLLSMLSILEDECNLKLLSKEIGKKKEFVSLILKDKKGREVKYATSDPNIIEDMESRKKVKTTVKEYDITIDLNSELITSILKSNPIKSSSVTFVEEKGKLFLVFGYSINNTNQIKIELEADEVEDLGALGFDADIFSKILSANSSSFESAKLEIAIKGLMRLSFKTKEGLAEYFLSKLQEENE